MYISRLILKNWRNFAAVDIELSQRVFVIGNNGVGKSNLLDVFRFLYDIAKEKGGGLQEAVDKRGGMVCIRSLFGGGSQVEIIIEIKNGGNGVSRPLWRYELALKQEPRGKKRVLVVREIVKEGKCPILARPTSEDEEDQDSMTQTALEQTGQNKQFRPLVKFLRGVGYLHLVPQMIRDAAALKAQTLPDDPHGQELLKEISALPQRSRTPRLAKISQVMKSIKPAFSDFSFERDMIGVPHLTYRQDNWHRHDVRQNEQQLSDGELRVIGLLWALLKNNRLVLLEEPEISLNEGIVAQLPGLFAKAVFSYGKSKRASQIILSTHSKALLSEQDIGAEEIVQLKEAEEGGATEAINISKNPDLAGMFEDGFTAAEVALPCSQGRLGLFFKD